MKDMVSIIVPVYNREKLVRECVESLLAQTHSNLEVVLIDDGSSDNSVEVCRQLMQEDPRVKLYINQHGGVSAARNRGLDEAQGEYLFFLDSDDKINPLVLEALVGAMKESGAEIGGTPVLELPDKHWARAQQEIDTVTEAGGFTYQDHKKTLHDVLTSTTPINLIGGVMIRRDLVGDTRFRTDLFIGEDFHFVYQNLIKGASSVFLTKKLYYCRLHTTNSSWRSDYAGFWSRFYRRVLVWQSEESLGRTEYANRQKWDAFRSFLVCMQNSPTFSADSKKMRKTMREYQKELLPSFSFGDKLRFYLAVYLPWLYMAIYHVKRRLSA